MSLRSCSLLASSRCRAITLPFRAPTQCANIAWPSSSPMLAQCRTKKTKPPKKTGRIKPANYTVNKAALAEKKRKQKSKRTSFATEDLSNQVQFSLCDAVRIIRATEAGYAATSPKYEMHIKLRTPIDGPILRNRMTLPHPVRTNLRVCVICPPNLANRAKAEGAVLAGTDEVFEAIKAGNIDFERCIAHESVVKDLAKSGVARILGPRRLMPSVKEKSIVRDVITTLREMTSSAEYREKQGVIRLSVGQLGFSPEQLQQNIQTIMKSVRRDITTLSDKVSKDIHEVVLSSTHGPGLSLNGEFASKDGIEVGELAERV